MRPYRQIDEFDRYFLIELSVYSVRQVNRSHPTAAQETIDLVRADALVFPVLGCAVVGPGVKRRVQYLLGSVSVEHGAHLFFQFAVGAALLIEQFRTIAFRSLQNRVED